MEKVFTLFMFVFLTTNTFAQWGYVPDDRVRNVENLEAHCSPNDAVEIEIEFERVPRQFHGQKRVASIKIYHQMSLSLKLSQNIDNCIREELIKTFGNKRTGINSDFAESFVVSVWGEAKLPYGPTSEDRFKSPLDYDCEKEKNPSDCKKWQKIYVEQFEKRLVITNNEFLLWLKDVKTEWVVRYKTKFEPKVDD